MTVTSILQQDSNTVLPCMQVTSIRFYQARWQLNVTTSIITGPDSVVGTATGYELDGPGIESRRGARFSAPVQTGHGAHPAHCTIGTETFPEVKSGRGVTLTPHLLLVPWSWKGRSIPLLPVWAVRLVHSLSACTRVQFTFIFTSITVAWLHNDSRSLKQF